MALTYKVYHTNTKSMLQLRWPALPQFVLFFLFGLINNVLYVIILSAAVDLVGARTPKAAVLLANILPSFLVKVAAPFFIHRIAYPQRMIVLVSLLVAGMLLVSLPPSIPPKIMGIMLASISLGAGEVTFLQLTHYYPGTLAVGGFSLGTGGAGIVGSFYYLFLTNICRISSWKVLLVSLAMPLVILAVYHRLLPPQELGISSSPDNILSQDNEVATAQTSAQTTLPTPAWAASDAGAHITDTIAKIKPLVKPYMLPLTLVYLFEYVINQGISPTLLYPLDEVPTWLIRTYRDTYVVYGFLYQLGVFISRLSINFGLRIHHLGMMAGLQGVNVGLCVLQLMLFTFPFPTIWLLFPLMVYEGLLGGFAYINTFVAVSEASPDDRREFNMGAVSMSDSLGIVVAGVVNWMVETRLCRWQVDHGRPWCQG